MDLPKKPCTLSLRAACVLIGVLDTLYRLSAIIISYIRIPRKFTTEQLHSFDFIMFFIAVISAVFLIGGAIWKNRPCLWQWIVVVSVRVILVLISTAGVDMIDSIISNFRKTVGRKTSMSDIEDLFSALFSDVLSAVPYIIIPVFFLCVVYSYICELREDEKRKKNDRNINAVYSISTANCSITNN